MKEKTMKNNSLRNPSMKDNLIHVTYPRGELVKELLHANFALISLNIHKMNDSSQTRRERSIRELNMTQIRTYFVVVCHTSEKKTNADIFRARDL